VWFDRRGRQLGSIGEEAGYTSVSLSSDGTRLIAGLYPPGSITDDFWLFDLTRGLPMRFTSTRAHETIAVWSPDDKAIIFGQAASTENPARLLKRSSDLTGDPTPILPGLRTIEPLSWSRDGKFLLYYTAPSNVSIVPLDGDRKPIPLALPSDVARAQLSPDGERVAYDSRESGMAAVYVTPLPGHPGGRIKASLDSGGWPRWSRDGKELFFLSNERLMVSAVHGQGSGLQIDLPRALFEVQHKNFAYGWPYDVSPDGRILVNVRSEQVPPVTLLVNWPALLKK